MQETEFESADRAVEMPTLNETEMAVLPLKISENRDETFGTIAQKPEENKNDENEKDNVEIDEEYSEIDEHDNDEKQEALEIQVKGELNPDNV